GKRRHERDLNLIEAGFADKLKDVIENVGRVAVKAKDKAPIHRDAVGLDFGDRLAIAVLLARFPVRVQLDSVQAPATRALEPDEDLLASRVAHQREEIVVPGDVDVRFGKPSDLFLREFAQQ